MLQNCKKRANYAHYQFTTKIAIVLPIFTALSNDHSMFARQLKRL